MRPIFHARSTSDYIAKEPEEEIRSKSNTYFLKPLVF
jgi:hypothetical protein